MRLERSAFKAGGQSGELHSRIASPLDQPRQSHDRNRSKSLPARSPGARLQAVQDEIGRISEMAQGELADAWKARMGTEAPQVSDYLLRLLIAYEVQRSEAPQSSGATAHLEQADQDKYPCSAANEKSTQRSRPGNLSVGTRLVREWNGQTIKVEVTEQGFAWNGGLHSSLSAIARKVTGTRWSGPRFFGISLSGAHD